MSRKAEGGELERSEELRSITTRLWAAWTRGDVEAVLARFSPMRGVSGFGTDPVESFKSPEQIERYTRAEFEALGGEWPLGPPEVDAWAEGDIGWSTVRSELMTDVPEGSHLLRCTFVFHLERDDWKVVHQHWSVGVPSEPVFGRSLPLEALAEVVGDEQPDLTHSASPEGTVTLVFTDIEDSTRLTASFGDRAWFGVLRAHNAIITDATHDHGGTVVKGQGDGYMLASRPLGALSSPHRPSSGKSKRRSTIQGRRSR